ncbi:MAG: class II fructose-1,6-bisphosphate aldolase [Candidatus Sigynarchaeota archaeon]
MPLVNSRPLFERASREGYAIGGFNVNNMELVQAIVDAAEEKRAPIIFQVSAGARKYARQEYLVKLVEAAVATSTIPIVLHLDHGEDFEICKACIDNGFSSVMIDRSHDPIEKNIEETKKVVDYAHKFGVQVEGELGILAGKEDNVSADKTTYTRPEDVEKFAKGTGVDSLAIAIGTSHGAYKFKPGQKPELRFDILQEVRRRLPDLPIVLHGASSVLTAYVDMINKYGGKMENAIGVPEDQLRKAASMGVCKINIDSDGRLVVTAIIRKIFAEKPAEFDPRKYLGPARDELIKMIMEKNKTVLGSEGKA